MVLAEPGVRVTPFDTGGRQVHDFDVVGADGSVAPLEVTLATIGELAEAQRAHLKHVGHWLEVGGLRNAWHVFSTSRSIFSRWTPDRLADLLRELEREDVEKFFFPMDAMRLPTAAAVAHQLGITAAFAGNGPGRVLVSAPNDDREWVSDHEDPGKHAIQTLERAAAESDNRRKLDAAGGPERHLFVWIDETNYLPWSDLDRGQVPRRAPELGGSVTTGWLATIGADDVVCWTYRSRHGWRERRFPTGNLTRR